MQWVRFDGDSDYDGMPWQTLGVGRLELRALKTIKKWKNQKIANRLGFLAFERHKKKSLLSHSGGFFLVTCPSPSQENIVEAGKTALKAWVFLNERGHSVQPLSLLSLSALHLEMGFGTLLESKKAPPDKIREMLTKEFDLLPGETPAWLFRTGKTLKEKTVSAPRRPTEEILTCNDAAYKPRRSGIIRK